MKIKHYYIYKTTNLINGKIYVGQKSTTVNPQNNKSYIGSGVKFNNAVKHYEKENFKKEIIEICTLENLDEREIFWIKELNAKDINVGYNLTDGGKTTRGYVPTKEHIKKIVDKNTGKKRSKEFCEEMRVLNTGRLRSEESKSKQSKTQTGRKLTKEHKSNIGKSEVGHITTQETKDKIGIANTGKIRSEEALKNLSEAHKGYIMPKEQKDKISQSNKDKPKSEEAKKKMRKPKTEEHKQNMRKPRSEESKSKMRKPKNKATCYNCGFTGGVGAIKRYHNENCKHKNK